ncbi:hypothetical protein ACKEW0_19145, partial [Yersinia enterocolitica]
LNYGLPVICSGELAINEGKFVGINNYSTLYRIMNLGVLVRVLPVCSGFTHQRLNVLLQGTVYPEYKIHTAVNSLNKDK